MTYTYTFSRMSSRINNSVMTGPPKSATPASTFSDMYAATEIQQKEIIIADDHAVVRTGLQLILDETHDLSIVDEARNGQELLDKLAVGHFDLVILDISMPGKDALDTLIEIKTRWPSLPVVIFSMNPDEAYAIRMLSNGASAYINKETKPRQIIEILRTVLLGRKYYSPLHAELMAGMVTGMVTGNPHRQKTTLPHTTLTDREFQIFSLLAMGIRTSEIAGKLSITKNTLSNHRNNIMKKMCISNNSELTRYAIQHGIIK
jgi:two-component system invasion response regulator UvrY